MLRQWIALFTIVFFDMASAATLNVPVDYSSIQAAVNSANVGDTIRVGPGRYKERLIVVRDVMLESSDGPEVTTIDAERRGTVVKFIGTTLNAGVHGFTITGGLASELLDGGGVAIRDGAASIVNNIVIYNLGAGVGSGISLLNAHALIRDNHILYNESCLGSGGGGGGGIGINGSGCNCGSDIINNVIVGNRVDLYTNGGGIMLNGAGPTSIIGNDIKFNAASYQGGGISIVGGGNVRIENNLIVGNAAGNFIEDGYGGGVYWGVPTDEVGPYLIGNTIADNKASAGSAVYAAGYDGNGRISNNIMVGIADHSVLECEGFNGPEIPEISTNDVFSGGVAAYGGLCAGSLGSNGNISIDPGFIAMGDYRIRRTSPAIDAGSNAWVTTTVDFAHRPRIYDDNGDGVATVDMGAYEFDLDPIFHDGFDLFP